MKRRNEGRKEGRRNEGRKKKKRNQRLSKETDFAESYYPGSRVK
jgi:hypothetical protein